MFLRINHSSHPQAISHYMVLDLLILFSPAADDSSNCTSDRHHCLKHNRPGVHRKVLELLYALLEDVFNRLHIHLVLNAMIMLWHNGFLSTYIYLALYRLYALFTPKHAVVLDWCLRTLLEFTNTYQRIHIWILSFKGRQCNTTLCADNTKFFVFNNVVSRAKMKSWPCLWLL